MECENSTRPSVQQFVYIMEFMERHGDLSIPFPGKDGRFRTNKLWCDLIKKLNTMGVNKTPVKWKKVWSDWKNNVKRKERMIKKRDELEPSTAENDIYYRSTVELRPLEERLLTFLRNTKQHPRKMSTEDGAREEGDGEGETGEEGADPLMPVKRECQWMRAGDDNSNNSLDFDRESSPPHVTATPLAAGGSAKKEGAKTDDRNQDRAEELHKLRVAERMWTLKTLRERHATAQLERERAQLEREWTLKTLKEKHLVAQVERERAQMQKQLVQMEIDRAKQGNCMMNSGIFNVDTKNL